MSCDAFLINEIIAPHPHPGNLMQGIEGRVEAYQWQGNSIWIKALRRISPHQGVRLVLVFFGLPEYQGRTLDQDFKVDVLAAFLQEVQVSLVELDHIRVLR